VKLILLLLSKKCKKEIRFLSAVLYYNTDTLNSSISSANNAEQQVRHSIVASIPACHAGDRGSIPRDGASALLV
jgi:hypothetical protein